MKFSNVVFLSAALAIFFATDCEAKLANRKVANEAPRCLTTIQAGEGPATTKEFELYLDGCLLKSQSDEVVEMPASMKSPANNGAIINFTAKIKMNALLFIFPQGEYEYHIYQGKIVGVTKAR